MIFLKFKDKRYIMENWIFSKSFDYPSENQLQVVKDKILESSQIQINIEKHLKSILKIVYHFAIILGFHKRKS